MQASERMRAVWIAASFAMMPAVAAAQSPAPLAAAPPGASSCSGCHGPFAANQAIPSLQGWQAADIAGAMQAFRDGKRQATVMGRIARGFGDDETKAIAQWLAKASTGDAK